MADGGRCNVCFGSSLVACGCLPALLKGLTTCMATVGGFIRPCVHLACRLGSCSGWTCSIVESMTWTWPSERKKWWMEANSKWVCFERVRRITSICQAPINQQSTFPCQATVWSWRMGQWFASSSFHCDRRQGCSDSMVFAVGWQSLIFWAIGLLSSGLSWGQA